MAEKRRTGRLGGIEKLAQELADDTYRRVIETFEGAVGDSPIERLLCAALRAVAASGGRTIESVYLMKPTDDLPYYQSIAESAGEYSKTAYMFSQVKTAGWRVDFVIYYPRWDRTGYEQLERLLIECDGHAFHERTKEQAARDRSRDRMAQHEGLPILRFTGSEIWNDPYECADEILAIMERA